MYKEEDIIPRIVSTLPTFWLLRKLGRYGETMHGQASGGGDPWVKFRLSVQLSVCRVVCVRPEYAGSCLQAVIVHSTPARGTLQEKYTELAPLHKWKSPFSPFTVLSCFTNELYFSLFVSQRTIINLPFIQRVNLSQAYMYCDAPWEGRVCGPCEWRRHFGRGRGQAPGPE
jgi:hypothetical protein